MVTRITYAIRRILAAVDFVQLLFGTLVGVLAGWIAADFCQQKTTDSGLATLVGSALGAGITVAGGMWAARYQTSAQGRAFSRFCGDATAGIRDEAYCLRRMAETQGVETRELHATKLLGMMERVKETIALWQKEMPYSGVSNYDVRLRLNRLEKQSIDTLRAFDREKAWLEGTVTERVINNAIANLTFEADVLLEHCEDIMNELKYPKPLPTEQEFAHRVVVFE